MSFRALQLPHELTMSHFIIYLGFDAQQHWAGENMHLPR